MEFPGVAALICEGQAEKAVRFRDWNHYECYCEGVRDGANAYGGGSTYILDAKGLDEMLAEEKAKPSTFPGGLTEHEVMRAKLMIQRRLVEAD